MKLPLKGRVASGLSALCILLSSVAFPALVRSQQASNGYRISPVRSEFVIEKGSKQVLTLTLENPADTATTAEAIVNDFVAGDKEDGEPLLILDQNAPAPKNSFRSLVQTINSVDLGAHEKKDIAVTISVPEDANAGGYYGAVRFVPHTPGGGAGNVGLTASVGSIVLVRVPGNLQERLDLIELSASQNGKAKSLLMSGDVSVLTRLENKGDIHVKPFGRVQIKNIFGRVVAEYELNSGATSDDRANILPGSIRKFEDQLAKPKRGWLGRYTISANIGYTQGSGDLISASTSFWYIPPWAFAVLLLLIATAIAGGYYFYRRYNLGRARRGKNK